MSQRLAALQALYDEGQRLDGDVSMDQSLTTYPRANTSLGLDSSASLDLPPAPAQNLLLSTEDERETSASNIEEEADDADRTPDTETAPTPKRPTSASATPRTATTRSSLYNTPAHLDESSVQDASSSISTSLRASQLAQSRDALHVLEEDEGEGDAELSASRSGHWGVQEMRRRTEAGISIKSTLQKIEQLTAERDDLKIEVDFHRRNMSPEDVGAEVISLRQEKLSYVRRLQKMNELVKSQDQALKTVNRQVKQWEAKLADYEQLQEQLRQAEARALAAEQGERAISAAPGDVAQLEAALRAEQTERLALQAQIEGLQQGRADTAPSSADEPSRFGDTSSVYDAPALQQQVDEQNDVICELQDALAAERLVVAEKEGEMDRLEAALDEAESMTTDLQAQLQEREAAHTAALTEVQQLTTELAEAHRHHESVEAALQEQYATSQAQLDEAQAAMERLSTQHADLEDLNVRLNDKLVQLVRDLKDEEQARERVDVDWSQRYDTSEAHMRHSLAAKDAWIESLEQQVAQARDEAQRLREEHRADKAQSQRSLTEAQAQYQRDANRLRSDLEEKLQLWQEAQDDVARLQLETSELAAALQGETRTRIQAQERLESTQRALDQARREAERASMAAAESARRDASSSARSLDASARPQLAERNALLAAVFDGLVRALGEDAAPSEARLLHTHFSQFHDKVTQRLRRLVAIQTHFSQRVETIEKDQAAKWADVRRLQEARWSHVERMEKVIRAATDKQQQWRRRLLTKEYELTDMQRANRELEQQVARMRDTPVAAPTPATPAQLSVRLRELERRCKEADERVKRERAGAKERATRDEARIRMMGVMAPPAPGPSMTASARSGRPLVPSRDLVRPWKGHSKGKDRARRAHSKRGRPRSRAVAPSSHVSQRAGTLSLADPPRPAAVWGHTQYTMLDHHAHATPGMRRSTDPPRLAASDEPSPVVVPEPARCHVATPALLAPFEAPEAPKARMCPVYMEGYGRLAMHRHVMDSPAPPSAPSCIGSQDVSHDRSERLQLVARWLATDEDVNDEEHVQSAGAGASTTATSTYHPMVAKGLREQSRRATARSSRAVRPDWWIAADGVRRPRGTPATAGRRRMVSTMHSLAASGIAPSMACRCGFTDDHMDMVQCDGCARWLHLACAGVSHVDQLPVTDWMCDDCYEQRTAMAQPRATSSAAYHTGLHAHARLRSSTLSLAPSPQRSLEDVPLMRAYGDASPAHVSASSDEGGRALWRTPSPPPSLQLVGTPSRHFTPMAQAEWLPTPTHFLAHTPYNGMRTPSRALAPLDSPTAATRRAQYLATPHSHASPSMHSDPVPSSAALSSPMPVTPTGPTRGRLLAMPLGSPATPKTAPLAQMPLAWAWE